MTYPWGVVAYTECVPKVIFPGATRLYSPHMLDEVFDWNTDLPEYDGLICRVFNEKDPVVVEAKHPIGLLWSNHSEQAVKKRSWGPGSVVTDALKQIPSGDFGIIYVAYQEGAREKMADNRTDGFMGWMQDIEHRDDIRVPLCRLIRLYPRALDHGTPDLIESNMPFVSQYGDEVLPRLFPATVFTKG